MKRSLLGNFKYKMLTLLIFWSSPCLSVIIADIDIVNFPITLSSQNPDPIPSVATSPISVQLNRHIRIAFFDTNSQQFLDGLGNPITEKNKLYQRSITYFSIPSECPSSYTDTLIFENWFNITCSYQDNLLNATIDLRPYKLTSNLSKVVRCNGKVLNNPKGSKIYTDPLNRFRCKFGKRLS
ncbi:MAG: hypothetical protein K0M45_05675 [Candidatus Paracaedibacteraceae bacterium]|nr:hypothetical protein [Candidatus Paracaedibacteraceae bacterium]